jgi:NAD(P)-dependent dehydrogenase (short-subunit alcohol dehydrogenase family)
MPGLDAKTVIITGAAGGIGRATARTVLEDGATVLLVDRPGSGLAQAGDELEASFGAPRVGRFEADVTSSAEVAASVACAVRLFGRVDGLFNNAGIEGPLAPIQDVAQEDFDAVLNVNVRGVWLGMKHAIPAMLESGGGSIVNAASGAAVKGLPGLGPYCASKHAVLGLTRVAAVELARKRIRVNAVCPGPVETRMMESLERARAPADPASARRAYEEGVPMSRYASPVEVAHFVSFLLSDAATYITGAALAIDGGATAA